VQDAINHNNLNKTFFSEKEMLRMFRDICKAVRSMHTYRVTESSHSHNTISEEDEAEQADIDHERPSQALLTEEQEEEPATMNVSSMETENVGEVVPYGKPPGSRDKHAVIHANKTFH
jgi:serine/threonine kinase 16